MSIAGAGPAPAALSLTLRVTGRLVVVVGGGSAADDAVGRLLRTGARVLVIAPELTAALAGLAARGAISVRSRPYQPADLDAAWLVLTCGPDEVNARVAADADERQTWSANLPAGQGEAATVTADLLDAAEPRAASGRRVLVLGGARSGKSATAESMLASELAVDYVATGQLAGAGDAEWDRRVRDHQARRAPGWRTIESCAVAEVLTEPEASSPVLVDCLATWLAQVMDECGLWSGIPDADARLRDRTDDLVSAWEKTTRHVVAVSNEVGCGVVPPSPSGRRFRDELGWLNSRIAAASEEVWLCTAGIPRRLR
jgi:adenosylcobinamide kinase/adenosylcobinamide-phosphate guanylyltransferase